MAIVLEANYSKKLGLPQFSSHQYSLTVRTEVSDLSQVENASSRLYRQLQEAVDRDIQETGFLPDNDGLPAASKCEHTTRAVARVESNQWACSLKQRDLIEKLMREHRIAENEVEQLAHFRFKNNLRQLNKMQASGLIDELFDTHSARKGARA